MSLPAALLDEITEAAVQGVLRHIVAQGARQIRVPTLGTITGACENVDVSFRVGDGRYLIQTGQLFLEASLRDHDHVCCEVWSSRNEAVDARHLAQFTLIEEEFRWTVGPGQATPEGALDSLLHRIETAARAGLAEVAASLPPQMTAELGGLQVALESEWPKITYDEAHAMISQRLGDRLDFTADDEQEILAVVARGRPMRPVFVTRYPEQIKFFNMRAARPDQARVLSVDLLLPYSGEAVGAAVREDEFDALRARLEASSMLRMHTRNGGAVADFDTYLEMIRDGVPPHAGYGLGLERLLQFALAEPDIRNVSAAYRRSAVLGWT